MQSIGPPSITAALRLQIAADLQTFLFCPSSVRLNAQKSCSFSLFQSGMLVSSRFGLLQSVCAGEYLDAQLCALGRSRSSFQHGHFAPNQCSASFFF
jgi:hypothetical protein